MSVCVYIYLLFFSYRHTITNSLKLYSLKVCPYEKNIYIQTLAPENEYTHAYSSPNR